MSQIFAVKMMLRLGLGAANLVLIAFFLTGQALAGEQYLDRDDRPVGGYDVVSYHTEVAPLEGLDSITAEYNGATWYFANEANRDLFVADPARYAPAYDGHCAFALANGRKVRTDPLVLDATENSVCAGACPWQYRKTYCFGENYASASVYICTCSDTRRL